MANFLYENQKDLVEKLSFIISNYHRFHQKRDHLSQAMASHPWENRIDAYDDALEALARLRKWPK